MHTLKLASAMLFLSTLSLRRATSSVPARLAPRAYFYPRSPCGERPIFSTIHQGQQTISIHALLAESDRSAHPETRQRDAISIHALLAESDRALRQLQPALCHFYPRSPCGERQQRT